MKSHTAVAYSDLLYNNDVRTENVNTGDEKAVII